jgi:hypothetical protein
MLCGFFAQKTSNNKHQTVDATSSPDLECLQEPLVQVSRAVNNKKHKEKKAMMTASTTTTYQ